MRRRDRTLAVAAVGVVALASALPLQAQEPSENLRQPYLTLRGLVQRVDAEGGQLDLWSDEQIWHLRGRPEELAAIVPGQSESLDCRLFGSSWWIEPDAHPFPPSFFARSGTAMGEVVKIDTAAGLLWFWSAGEPLLLRTHPTELSALLAGEVLVVRWAMIGGQRWVLGASRPEARLEWGKPKPSPAPGNSLAHAGEMPKLPVERRTLLADTKKEPNMSWFRSMLLGVLMAPAVVLAQGANPEPQADQPPQAAGKPAEKADTGAAPKAAITGRVHGVVTNVDYSNGQMSVKLSAMQPNEEQRQPNTRGPGQRPGVTETQTGEIIALQGTPAQVSHFKEGALADLSYEQFGNKLWLTSVPPSALSGSFAQTSTISGTVSKVDKARGTVELNEGPGMKQTFEAHPDTIKSLVPGQFISLTYNKVAQHDWVTSLGEAGSQGQAGSQTK